MFTFHNDSQDQQFLTNLRLSIHYIAIKWQWHAITNDVQEDLVRDMKEISELLNYFDGVIFPTSYTAWQENQTADSAAA